MPYSRVIDDESQVQVVACCLGVLNIVSSKPSETLSLMTSKRDVNSQSNFEYHNKDRVKKRKQISKRFKNVNKCLDQIMGPIIDRLFIEPIVVTVEEEDEFI